MDFVAETIVQFIDKSEVVSNLNHQIFELSQIS